MKNSRMAIAVLLTGVIALAGLVAVAPRASADWAHDKCSYYELKEGDFTITCIEAVGPYTPIGSATKGVKDTYTLNWSTTATATLSAGASIGLDKLIGIAVEGKCLCAEVNSGRRISLSRGQHRSRRVLSHAELCDLA